MLPMNASAVASEKQMRWITNNGGKNVCWVPVIFFSGLVHNSMYCTVNQLCIFLPTRDPNALYSFKFLSVAMDTRLPRPADTALGISSLQISECFLRCFAHMPTGYLTNEGDTFNDSGLVEKYGNTFINVKDWGDFEQSDINRNGLTECPRFCRRVWTKIGQRAGSGPWRALFVSLTTLWFWWVTVGVWRLRICTWCWSSACIFRAFQYRRG